MNLALVKKYKNLKVSRMNREKGITLNLSLLNLIISHHSLFLVEMKAWGLTMSRVVIRNTNSINTQSLV